MTEPTYTNAQIPDVETIMSHLPDNRAATRHELYRALALASRQAAMQGQRGEVHAAVKDCAADLRKHAKQCHDLPKLADDLRRMANKLERKFAAALQPPQPVRSVSDEDAHIDSVAKLIADKLGNGMREKYEDVARQIVELLSDRQAAMQGQGGEVVELSAWVGDMKTSAGMDYYVCVGTAHEYGKYQTPNHYKIRGRAEYDVACWNHMLGRGDEPSFFDFDVDTPPQPVRSVSDEDVESAMDAHNHAIYRNGNNRKLAMRAALEHFAAIAQEKQS